MKKLDGKLGRWVAYDDEAKKYTFQPTEDYVWGMPGYKKRIGDMERGELMRVIAMNSADRGSLAQALLLAVAPLGENIPKELESAVASARLIVKRINEATSE